MDFGNIANKAYEIATAGLSWLDKHNGAVTALATAVIGWFTYELYKANNLAIGHTRTIERAYVKMSHSAPGLGYGSNNDIVVTIALKNFGKTPARIDKVVLKAEVFSPGQKLPERPDYSNNQFEQRSDAFLVTNDEIFIYSSMQLDPNTIQNVQLGQSRLIVLGYVDYIDQFDVGHRSGYAREYDRGLQNNLIYMAQPGYNYDDTAMKNGPLRRTWRFLAQSSIWIFTAVVAVATAVQALAFIASERAIVTVPDLRFAKELVAGLNPLPIFFEMKNSGKSTATVDVLKAVITHGPLPPIPEYGGAANFTIAPIVPNDTSQRILPFDTSWNEQTTQGVKAGTLPLFVYGVINYHDDWRWFAANRETGFCFWYRPTGGVREPVFETCNASTYTYTR